MTYPLGERVTPTNARAAVACVHCTAPIAVSTWDKFNGFLVECPSCHGFHGRRWNIRGLVFASFLLNALSFFFTMRPGKAFAAIVAWVLVFWLVMPRAESWPEWAEALAFGTMMLGPVIINAVLLVRHQIDLDRAPLSAAARTRS